MADFKLTEVAKKAGLSPEEALEKLAGAGEKVSDVNANLTVEQMRLLGIDPQQMIDRRKERLQQVLERRGRSSMGKEVVMNARNKEESAAAPARKISREELQKRKSELNKDVQKVDEARQAMKLKEAGETQVVADEEVREQPVVETEKPDKLEKPEETVKIKPVDTQTPKVDIEVSSVVEKEAAPKAEAKRPARPLGPAGYVPREQQQRTTGPRTNTSGQQQAGRSSRPSGPAGTGGAGQRPAGGQQRSGSGFPARTEQTPLVEEERRWESKKVKEAEPAVKDDKKPKAKTDTKKTKDWNKTINEGLGELDIEKEIDSGQQEEVEVPVQEGRPVVKLDKKKKKQQHVPQPVAKPTSITIGESVVVSDLAGMIGVKAAELVKKLFSMGIMATVNQAIASEVVELLVMEYGIELETKIVTEEDFITVYEDKPEDMERRPPVVTVMGHVDHGKTSLLDAIRSTSVAEREAGGITQHIGAYEVELSGKKLTFLDTPGHEAFTSLRARGAQATDIVILVVAANDGVMPQTKEAIDHAKAAGVRIVVAVNKIDVPDANPAKVRQQLADYGILSDEWGGEYQFQEISAKQRMGIEDLLERVLLEADILELKGNPKRPAEGIVIESQLDKQKGPVATILVRNGTLRRGDMFVVGTQYGKVRSMHNHRGQVVKEALISMPVEVMGFSEVPEAGDLIMVLEDEKAAKSIVDLRQRHAQEVKHSSGVVSLSDFFDKVKQGEIKELNIIIKSDVQGSLEALKSSLLKLSNPEVKVNVVHDATGGINESDVVLAMASKAIIIGFNVRPDNNARALAEREGVSIELYSIIYKAIEDVKLAMEGMLTPDTRESVTGRVEVRQVFSVPKIGKIAGCYVLEGKVTRNSLVHVIRDNVVVFDGKVGSLKRFTDDVREVASGYECGMSIDKWNDVKDGDIFEVYEIVEEKRTLEDVRIQEEKEKQKENE